MSGVLTPPPFSTPGSHKGFFCHVQGYGVLDAFSLFYIKAVLSKEHLLLLQFSTWC